MKRSAVAPSAISYYHLVLFLFLCPCFFSIVHPGQRLLNKILHTFFVFTWRSHEIQYIEIIHTRVFLFPTSRPPRAVQIPSCSTTPSFARGQLPPMGHFKWHVGLQHIGIRRENISFNGLCVGQWQGIAPLLQAAQPCLQDI